MTLNQFITGITPYGTNDDDRGECIGLVNAYIRDVLGLPLYPIQGVIYAKDFLKGRNTRPDIFEVVYNNQNDDSQLPSVGDILVMSGLDARGHTGVVIEVTKSYIKIYDQYQGQKPAIRTRYWSQGVIGWFHIKKGESMPRAQDVVSAFNTYQVPGPTQQQIDYYTKQGWNMLLDDLLKYVANRDKSRATQIEQLNGTIQSLNSTVKELSSRPTKEELTKAVQSVQTQLDQAIAEYNELKQHPVVMPFTDDDGKKWLLRKLSALFGAVSKFFKKG